MLSRVRKLPVLLASIFSAFAQSEAADADDNQAPRAARSVHLGWQAPPGDLFYTEMSVEKSVPGSYFMAAGWNTGYFGIQEISAAKKVVIFSVWDAAKGDDPKAVPEEQRVEVLHQDPDVRIKRFGGEGTGGQCMWPFDWQIGATYRFCVQATVHGEKTAYTAFFYLAHEDLWKKLATFRTWSKGSPLKGYYSFVEDFRRDTKSVHEIRRARFGNGWVRTVDAAWVPLTSAKFTASNATWESKENIDAGLADGMFYLATGGDLRASTPLNSRLEQPSLDVKPPTDLPMLAQ